MIQKRNDRGAHVICWAVLLFSSMTHGRTLIISDFDNTIVETRQEFRGTFKTAFRLFRVEKRGSTLEQVATGPEFIDVSPVDFHRAFKYLALSATQVQSINLQFTLEDRRVFTPGHYYIQPRSTYRHFFAPPGLEVTSSLLGDLDRALQAQPHNSWQGPFFEHMTRILETEQGRESFGLLTARGHSLVEWQQFFARLQSEGLIVGVPENLSLIHNVGDPRYDGFGIDGAIAGRKVEVLREAILALSQVPVTPVQQIVAPNGGHKITGHVLVYAEDNQSILDGVVALFQDFARRQRTPIKFVVFNAGNGQEIAASKRPRFAVIKSNGSFRAMTQEELHREIYFSSNESCDGFVKRRNRKARQE